MKKVLYLSSACFLLLSCSSSAEQKTTVDAPKDNTTVATTSQQQPAQNNEAGLPISSFVPSGYEILSETKGDLNKDAQDDAILILKKSDEADDSKRPALILIGVDGNGYEKAAENDNAVLKLGDGGAMGDPFSGVTIKDGYFTLEHMGGASERWNRFITFKYDATDKKFYLHKDTIEGFNTDKPDKVLYNHTKTTKDFGKVAFEDFSSNN